MTQHDPAIDHYGTADLIPQVTQALHEAGLGEGILGWQALAPLDQFHVGGAAATEALARRLAIPAGATLLDIGGGLGGPARYLATEHHAQVTSIDLSQPFTDLATALTARAGLSATVRHIRADATQLPFAPESFDLVWTQHAVMNIANRPALYQSVHRVLRPNGRFAMFDIVARNDEPLTFPVPWATRPEDSHLLTAEATLSALREAGFVIQQAEDVTAEAIGWAQTQAAAQQSRPDALRSLGLPLIMGPSFPAMVGNLQANLRSGRLGLLQAIAERPQ